VVFVARLTCDHFGTNQDENYSYDANGNRTNSGYSTSSDNRLTSDGTYIYTYDDEGNLIQRVGNGTTRTFSWDYRNRLTSVTENGATIATYTYDVMDRRITKSAAGSTTQFVYDGDNVILEFNGTATLSVRYLQGPGVDQVLAQEKAGTTSWMLTDHLGTVRDLVNNAGSVVNHFTYDSFGKVLSATPGGVDTRYKFTGRELDAETGLYYYRARYFDANVGRFIGQDPIGFSAGDSNLYRYVGNSPVSNTDPSGLQVVAPPAPVIPRVVPVPRVLPPVPIGVPSPQQQQPLPQPQPSRPDPNSCPPCESFKQGGSYREVFDSNKCPGRQVHHTPSWAATRDSAIALGSAKNGYDLAPAICMKTEDHRKTRSYAGSNRNYKPIQVGLINSFNYNGAQDLDIADIRQQFGNKYNVGIIQMRNYTTQLQTTRPELFQLVV
jgi:RHS repeat-associated protein